MSLRAANSRDSLTITLKNAIKASDVSTIFDKVFTDLQATYTSIDAGKLKGAIINKYALYDINIPTKGVNKSYGFDDIKEFVEDLERALWLKAPYYNELISNYNKAYDYSTGNKRHTLREDSWERSGEKSSSGSSNGTHKEYELPNKVVAQDYQSTPSSIDTDNGTSSNSEEDSSTTTGTSETTVTYDNEFLDLKRKYLAQIRNIYEDYADEVKECFYLIFYTNAVKEEE